MKTLTRRLLAGLTSDNAQTTSWGDHLTGEQLLRANSALSSLQCDVFMGTSDDKAVATAKLLLRGVARQRWSQ